VGKPVLVTPTHCKKENVLITPACFGKKLKRKMAMITHAHCKKKKGHGNSRPSRKGKRAGK
jgi:hypothetical protein